jgi:hypothetical protein
MLIITKERWQNKHEYSIAKNLQLIASVTSNYTIQVSYEFLTHFLKQTQLINNCNGLFVENVNLIDEVLKICEPFLNKKISEIEVQDFAISSLMLKTCELFGCGKIDQYICSSLHIFMRMCIGDVGAFFEDIMDELYLLIYKTHGVKSNDQMLKFIDYYYPYRRLFLFNLNYIFNRFGMFTLESQLKEKIFNLIRELNDNNFDIFSKYIEVITVVFSQPYDIEFLISDYFKLKNHVDINTIE